MIKEIIINGEKWYYQVYFRPKYYSPYNFITYFCKEEDLTINTYKKYIFFGKRITTKSMNHNRFYIIDNIENTNYSKKDVQNIIDKALVIYNRKLEIEKGNII